MGPGREPIAVLPRKLSGFRIFVARFLRLFSPPSICLFFLPLYSTFARATKGSRLLFIQFQEGENPATGFTGRFRLSSSQRLPENVKFQGLTPFLPCLPRTLLFLLSLVVV